MTLLRSAKIICAIGLVLVIVTTLRARNVPTPGPAPAIGNLSSMTGAVVSTRELTRKTVRNRMVVSHYYELDIDRPGAPVTVVLDDRWMARDKVAALVGQVVEAKFDAGDKNHLYTLAVPQAELVHYADVAKAINIRNASRATDEPIFRGFAWVLFVVGAIAMVLGWWLAWAKAYPKRGATRSLR